MKTHPVSELTPPRRLLLGPGPSMVHPRVLRAMSTPLIGHLDPVFLELMDEVQRQLRWLFGTDNAFTIPISGTGSAAMEAVIVNLVEPGDSVVVGVNGIFGTRIAHMVERCGGTAIRIEAPWGYPIESEHIEKALQRHAPIKAVAMIHAETSTGVCQPLNEISKLCSTYGALLIVDTVTSLGGQPVKIDEWNIDACFSATQKCLSCPPGLAPLTLNTKALDIVRQRTTPCQSWYLDFSLIQDYWADSKRTYHHTAPISMMYALRESLRLIQEEGLEPRWGRHRLNCQALLAGLSALDFELLPTPTKALSTLICVKIPSFLEDRHIRTALLRDFGIEIGGGLGPLAGQVWRIGLMGESSRPDHVLAFLSALEQLMPSSTFASGAALSAAQQVFQNA